MTDVLARRDRALSPEETEALLRERCGAVVLGATVAYNTFTLHVAPEGWVEVARTCRDEPQLAFEFFDCLFGVDAREEGFDVVAVLYSPRTGNRIALRARVPGGRDAPVLASLTEVYRGADWMERETWDMFGVEFAGHPGLAPRILTVDNFEGWPLRKDFHLASRVAKPWPGVKEPAELDEDGNIIERVTGVGDAPGPYDLDKAMAAQAREANPAPEPEPVPEPAETEPEPAELDGSAGDETGGSDTAATADARRREQAEARARKAAERAGEEGGA